MPAAVGIAVAEAVGIAGPAAVGIAGPAAVGTAVPAAVGIAAPEAAGIAVAAAVGIAVEEVESAVQQVRSPGQQVGSAAELGVALARAREANGWSQRETAAALGISQRYVVEMEAGKPSLYSERLFAFLALTGLELAVTQPDPAARLGRAPVLWPRAATEADAVALHAIDPRRSVEDYAALAGAPDAPLAVVDEQVDWPKRRSRQLQREAAGQRLGTIAGYRLGDELFVAPGPRGQEVRDALRLARPGGGAFRGRSTPEA